MHLKGNFISKLHQKIINLLKGALYSNFDFPQNNIFYQNDNEELILVHFVLRYSKMELGRTKISKLLIIMKK